MVSGPYSWGPNPRHIKGAVRRLQAYGNRAAVRFLTPLRARATVYGPALQGAPQFLGPLRARSTGLGHMGVVASRRMVALCGSSHPYEPALQYTRPRYRFGDILLGPQPQTYGRRLQACGSAFGASRRPPLLASPPGAWLASGHGSGPYCWGPNPRHMRGRRGSSPPGVWAGPYSWGPNPRHVPQQRRLQAYGYRGRFGVPPNPLRARATDNGPALQ
eukprot:gene24643-biopygen11923